VLEFTIVFLFVVATGVAVLFVGLLCDRDAFAVAEQRTQLLLAIGSLVTALLMAVTIVIAPVVLR
jgi:hypothetical protein